MQKDPRIRINDDIDQEGRSLGRAQPRACRNPAGHAQPMHRRPGKIFFCKVFLGCVQSMALAQMNQQRDAQQQHHDRNPEMAVGENGKPQPLLHECICSSSLRNLCESTPQR